MSSVESNSFHSLQLLSLSVSILFLTVHEPTRKSKSFSDEVVDGAIFRSSVCLVAAWLIDFAILLFAESNIETISAKWYVRQCQLHTECIDQLSNEDTI